MDSKKLGEVVGAILSSGYNTRLEIIVERCWSEKCVEDEHITGTYVQSDIHYLEICTGGENRRLAFRDILYVGFGPAWNKTTLYGRGRRCPRN